MWPSDGFEANQFSPAGEVAAFANLFQGIRRRWRRTSHPVRIAVGLAVVAGILIYGLLSGVNGSHLPPLPSSIPKGATPVATRSIDGWTLRIYTSSSVSAGVTTNAVSYEQVDPRGDVLQSDTGPLPPAGCAVGGSHQVVPDTGSPGNFIFVCQVMNPAITAVKVAAAGQVLDSMTPVAFNGIDFVVLDAIERSSAPLVIEGVDSTGRTVSSQPVTALP